MPKPSALEFKTALLSRISEAAKVVTQCEPVDGDDSLQQLQEILSEIGDYIWNVTRAEQAAKEREESAILTRRFARETRLEDLQMMLDGRVQRFVGLLRHRAPGPILRGDAVLILQACERIFLHAPTDMSTRCPECAAPADAVADRSPGWTYLGALPQA